MIFSKLSVLTFIPVLFACNQASKKSDPVQATNSTRVDSTRAAIKNTGKQAQETDSSINNEEAEDKIMDTIFKLPEVKERAKYIEEQTNGKRHLTIWVAGDPDLPDQKYYWVKAGEDNGTNLMTHFDFYVYPDSMRIMYYDPQSDSEWTLDKWRKVNSK